MTQVTMTKLRVLPAQETLMKLNNWVLWRSEERNGKLTKVPYSARTGECAKVNDQSSWSTYALASSRLAKYDFSGVGFMFSEQAGFTGIDIDHCVDDQGVISDQALAIIVNMNSYCEYSPSGHGVHIFIRGMLPDTAECRTGVRRNNIEMYRTGRYFTYTGKHVPGTPTEIHEAGFALRTLYSYLTLRPEHEGLFRRVIGKNILTTQNLSDNEIIDKMMHHPVQGEKIAKLWRGFLGDHHYDRSAADMALCGHLAFWTNRNKKTMDRLFRRSCLMRDKWDEVHSGDGRTYGELTIDKACSGRCR